VTRARRKHAASEDSMKLRALLGALALVAAGCRSLPPEDVRARIQTANADVRAYVTHEQQEIALRLLVLRAAADAPESEPAREALRRMIERDERFLRLGGAIPTALQVLEDWAEGREAP
jgi:hypothetical protein